MNKKYYLVLLLSLVLPSCSLNIFDKNSSSSMQDTSSSSKVEIINNDGMTNIDEYQDTHVYSGLKTKDFPTFSENKWNTSLKFTLNKDGESYTVSDNLGGGRLLNTDTLIIPAYYKGLPVTRIAQAIEGVGSFAELTWLKTVYLPHTIKYIEYGSFSLSAIETLYIDCENLEDFDGRNWVFYPSIDTSYKGMDVYFGPNVKRIPSRLFYPNVAEPQFVPKINNVYFDEDCKVTSIGDHAFHNVSGFTSLSLPNTIESIEEYAFYNTSFTELVLPSSLKTIANDAFEFAKVEHIKVNDKLESIGERAFAYSKLTGIDLSSTSVDIIEDEAFAYNSSLKGIKFSSSLKDICERAFIGSGLVNLTITDSVTNIGKDAFANNESLEKLYLGKNVKVLEDKAFYNTKNLTLLNIASTSLNDLAYGNQVFTNAGKINGMQVYVVYGVKSIPNNMFFGTSDVEALANITTLSIPTSLERIGENAFSDIMINEVDYRGTKEDFNRLQIGENGLSYKNIKFGGNNNA